MAGTAMAATLWAARQKLQWAASVAPGRWLWAASKLANSSSTAIVSHAAIRRARAIAFCWLVLMVVRINKTGTYL